MTITRHRSRLAILLATALLWTGAARGDAAGDAQSEYRVKAAFIYNFARFVEWPTSSDGVMRVCLLDPDPFGEVLEATVAGKTAHGDPFDVRRIDEFEPGTGCDVVFVGDVGARRQAGLLDAIDGRPVLTIGDDTPFAADGGMINFVVERGKVGFEINRTAADDAGLRISSKLLGLARLVEPAQARRGASR